MAHINHELLDKLRSGDVVIYHNWLEALNDTAFEYCKQHLYRICDYRVLQLKDIRKIDLEEKCIELRNLYFYELGQYADSDSEYFLNQLWEIFEDCLKCEEHSRAYVYYKRAQDIMSGSDEDDVDLNGLIVIYVSLLREKLKFATDSNSSRKKRITDADFMISKNDADMLEQVRTNKNIAPDSIRNPKSSSNYRVSGYMEAEKNFMYMLSILLLTYALQDLGEFSTEEY